jgi:predicted histidine transporter YuiF (NhaC family)
LKLIATRLGVVTLPQNRTGVTNMKLMAFSLVMLIVGLIVVLFDGFGYNIDTFYVVTFIFVAVGVGFYSLIVGADE